MPLPKYEFVYEFPIEKGILYYIGKRSMVFSLQPFPFKLWTTYFFFQLTRPINIGMNIEVWDNIAGKFSHIIVTL